VYKANISAFSGRERLLKAVISFITRTFHKEDEIVSYRSVVPDLLAVLHDTQNGSDLRTSVALALGHLGERSLTLRIIRSVKSSGRMSGDVEEVLGQLRAHTTIRAVASLLRRAEILADQAHEILWDIN
jgi:hypothetical protein